MIYQVTHITRYHSQERISLGMNRVCLRPRKTPNQEILSSSVSPVPHATTTDRRVDYFGNLVELLAFEHGYQDLEIRSRSRVNIMPRQFDTSSKSANWESLQVENSSVGGKDHFRVVEMAVPSPLVENGCSEIRKYTQKSFASNQPIIDGLNDLLKRFDSDFEFDNSATTVNTLTSDVFSNRHGVCQDFAHLMIAMLRSIGLAARYVSGYIRTIAPEGKERLRGADASHAWLSVFCGELGWVDIDPTNCCFVDEDHVTVAWGRDYSDVTPVRGVIIGDRTHDLEVSVDVEPI